MFQKGKASTVPSDNQAKEKLASYVYEYLMLIGAPKAAQSLLQEIRWEKSLPVGEAPGFLSLWWCVFYDLYSAAPERRESFEHSSEAKAFHDYGFVNSPYPNGLTRNPSIASPISGGMPPTGGRPPSSQGIMPPDNGIHTPVPIPGGGMMAPSAHFFPPGSAPNLGAQSIEMMRNRALQHSMRFGPVNPMIGNYHPVPTMSRNRYSQPQSVAGMAHSPGPSGTPQLGPANDPNLQNDGQQNPSCPDSFVGPNGGSSTSSRSPSHGMSQPAPAFPPPPSSENNQQSDQSSHPSSMMNGGGGPPQFSQHQQQSHTMEYMPPGNMTFDPSSMPMKHSPQLHHQPSNMSDVIASMSNGMPAEFCNPMMQTNGPSFPSNDHHGGGGMRGPQPSLHHMGVMPPISQMHMMQQGLGNHHGPLSMQSMQQGGLPPGSFMSHSGAPISAAAASQYPDYAFTSMSQTI